MPGPISDSYDIEFGIKDNARDVKEAIINVRNKITSLISDKNLNSITEIVHRQDSKVTMSKRIVCHLSERELRIIRFAMNKALESI